MSEGRQSPWVVIISCLSDRPSFGLSILRVAGRGGNNFYDQQYHDLGFCRNKYCYRSNRALAFIDFIQPYLLIMWFENFRHRSHNYPEF
jgi:hypothetical protein